jgi:3-phenylpropionate/trans-cinnamate dioxygenase ferredoxin component
MNAESVEGYTRVAALSDVPPGTLLRVELDGLQICLANADGEIYALRDNCSHRDYPLTEGALEDGVVECSWHGARFDVATGRALSLPAIKPVRTFEVRVEGEDIFVAV